MAGKTNPERDKPMLTRIIKWTAIAALVGGVLLRSSPYFGPVLQFLVTAAAVVVFTQAAATRRFVWMTLFLVVACVFNPFFPVPLVRYVFAVATMLSLLLFFFSLEQLKSQPRLSIASITDRTPGSEAL
jgi:hypothetical protein